SLGGFSPVKTYAFCTRTAFLLEKNGMVSVSSIIGAKSFSYKLYLTKLNSSFGASKYCSITSEAFFLINSGTSPYIFIMFLLFLVNLSILLHIFYLYHD